MRTAFPRRSSASRSGADSTPGRASSCCGATRTRTDAGVASCSTRSERNTSRRAATATTASPAAPRRATSTRAPARSRSTTASTMRRSVPARSRGWRAIGWSSTSSRSATGPCRYLRSKRPTSYAGRERRAGFASARRLASARPRPRLASGRALPLDERHHLVPRSLALLRVFGGLAVEEAVGRARVGDDPVVDGPFPEAAIECRDRFSGDAPVGTTEQAEDRRGDVVDPIERGRGVVPPRALERPVQPDDTGQMESERRGEEGHAAAHAEADREDPVDPLATEGFDGGRDVARDTRPSRPLGVGHVLERVAAWLGAGRPPEIVDGEGIDAAFRETQGELLVERMQPAHVGEDDDAGATGLGRPRSEGGEAVPVGTRDLGRLAVESAAGDREDRRSTVGGVAHERLLRGCCRARTSMVAPPGDGRDAGAGPFGAREGRQ